MEIEFTELHPNAQHCFLCVMQAALMMKSLGQNQDMFVEFARECWETMLLNDTATLEDIIIQNMSLQIKTIDEEN